MLHNGRKVGLDVSRWNGGHLYELIANNVYCKCTMKGLAGNVGVNVGVCDCHFTDVIVVDCAERRNPDELRFVQQSADGPS